MSFFKKKDEDRKTIRPKLRPANFGSEPKEKSGTSGKGGGEAKPAYDTSAKGWSDQVAKFNKKGGINNDGRFGYGYVDTQTGIEVPWYIDMINGGGANAAGDTFVSPYSGTPTGLPAQAVTGGLNAMGVAPYGYNRPRYFMPMEAARVDAEGKPVQVDQGAAPRPTSGGSTSSPNLMNIPNSMTDDDMGLPSVPAITPDVYGIGRGGEYAGVMTTPQAGPSNTTMTTPAMDFMYNMAKRTVMQRYPTMPAQEQELKAQEEYNRLMLAMGG